MLNSIHGHVNRGLDNLPMILYWKIPMNRIDSSYPHGTYNTPPSPRAPAWGEL